METNKYYIPEISDFYVGFEYELYCRDVKPTIKNGSTVWLKSWQTKIFTKAEFERGIGFDRNLDLQDDWIRVKYLDKSDIESLGFEYDVNYSDLPELGFLRDTNYLSPYTQYLLRYNPVNKNVRIERIVNCGTGIDDYLFNGIIKNKSELVKLLKQLRINAQSH